MEILQKENTEKGKFYIEVDGKEVAEMHYIYADKHKLIIDHTEVSIAYEGRGLGKQLLGALVKFVRENNIKVVPLCPFAKGVFDRVEEYRDVLA